MSNVRVKKPLPTGLDWLPSGNIRVRVLNASGVQVTVGTYATRADALAAHRAALTDIERGDWIDPANGKITFAELAEQVARYREHDLAESTQRNNASLLKMLLPTFGSRPVNKISVALVDLWWAKHSSHPVNRRNAYFLLSSVLRYGMRWGYVRQSPCQVDKAGADVSVERPTHSVEEFRAVVEHLDPMLQRAVSVMFGAHLRISELAGLEWRDWNWKTSKLTVQRQVQRNRTQETAPTKGRKHKAVKVLQEGADALQEQSRLHPGLGAAPIFRGPAGGRLRVQWVRKHWYLACAAAGVEEFHLHDIRHVSLTYVAPGASLKEVMQRGGHSTERAALRYQAASADRDSVIADAASRRLAQGL